MRTTPEVPSAEKIRVRKAIECAIENDGIASGADLYPREALPKVQAEAKRARLLRRKINAWVNTERATLVPISAFRFKAAHHIIANSEVWMPATTGMAYELSESVRYAGRVLKIPALACWQPTRIGVNYMHGTEDDPAVIPRHTDPVAESGLVAVMQLAPEDEVPKGGSLEFILGADVCGQLGMLQPVHEVVSVDERMSLTIANLI